MKQFLREFYLFTLKEASACVFGAVLLALILLTKFYYPANATLARYDFLFLAAIILQVGLLLFKFEKPKEALVIIIFHFVATGMEIFKTSESIGSWTYPEQAFFKIGNVPLFAGFMYSAVGSYIARIWRLFDFRFSSYPPTWHAVALVTAIYANFFTHHYFYDIRWILLGLIFLLFGRVTLHFKIDVEYRRMPLLFGCILVALFIWFAENISTFAGIWLYPNQKSDWSMVPISKLVAWFLLLLLSFVLVSLIHRPQLFEKKLLP